MYRDFVEHNLWLLSVPLREAYCFLRGHKEVYGGPMEDDWCDRCFVDWPQDKITLPRLLNRAYCWAVEHGWPETVDLWLHAHFKMPDWWEY